jgi:hypothetical protein
MQMARLTAITLVALLCALPGCSRHGAAGPPGAASAANPPGASGTNPAGPPPAAAAWAGHVLRGGNPAALRRYLQTVEEVKATRFNVQWNPATVAIDREAAIRSLRGVSRDGATFTFAAAEPVVAKLKPGSILWVRDLALRKVDGVETRADLTIVHTQVVSLNEAMPNADLAFEAPVPVQNFILSRPPLEPPPPPDTKTGRAWPAAGGLVPVRYLMQEGPGGGGSAPGGDDAADQAQEDSFQGGTVSGTLQGMQYTLGYNPGAGGALTMVLESRLGAGGGGGSPALKELFSIVDDNVDVRLRAEALVHGFSTAAVMQIAGGNLTQAQIEFRNVSGHVKAAFIGRLGHPGNEGLKIPVMHLPVSFNIPLPVEGIPFVVQLGADFLVTVALSGNNASLTIEGGYDFGGTGGFNYAGGTMSDSSSSSGVEPVVAHYEGMSPGASAVVLGVQLPRIGFGLGVTGVASSVAYFDIVHVLTMTQAGSIGVGLAPRCQRMTYNAVGHVGVETSVLLIPVAAVQQWASDKLSAKKEVFNTNKEVLDPPVKACQI